MPGGAIGKYLTNDDLSRHCGTGERQKYDDLSRHSGTQEVKCHFVGGGYCHHHVWPCVRVSFPDDIFETVSRIAFILHTDIP